MTGQTAPRDRYPHVPGHKEEGTSREAADSMREAAPLLRDRVLRAIANAGGIGCTADEVAEILGISVLSVRPRVSELRQMGRIRSCGDRRKNDSGRQAWVWRAA